MGTFFEIENEKLLSCQIAEGEIEITIPENVKIIGEAVFKGNRKIKKITLPKGLEIIGAEAFKSVTEITEICLPETLREIGNDAFKGCKNLAEIHFPNGLLKIGEYAFHRCHSLKKALLPDSVDRIGKCAFLYCDGLEIITLGGVLKLERQTFANCTSLREIHLNSGLETDNLGDDIFTGCTNIQKISLSDGRVFEFPNLISILGKNLDPVVESIAQNVYKSMELKNGILYKLSVNLKNFEIPEGISTIEKSCFFDKKGITRIVFPRSLTAIKTNAFANCINLEEVVFQSDPEIKITIDDKAFKGCNNLERVIFGGETYFPKQCLSGIGTPEIIRKIGFQILSDFYISGKILVKYRGSEQKISVPDSIEIIGESCFENNQNIDRIILPNSVKEIRESAFKNCVSLQSVELSDSLEVIERSAFENCKKLLKISLPNSVKRLGESVFKRCVKLGNIDLGDDLESIGDMTFYGDVELKSIKISEKTELCGDLIFFGSGVENEFKNAENYPEKEPEFEDEKSVIKPYEFCKNTEITSLKLTEKTRIGKYAFSASEKLSELIIDAPDCVVGEHSFEKCSALKSVFLNVKAVEKSAFSFCKNLEKVEIRGAEFIDDLSFCGCEKLETVIFSDSVKALGERVFEECVSLKSFDFNKLESIGERCFSRCDGLEKITIPSTVSYISRRGFEDCCNLKLLEITEKTKLKSNVFFGCTYLNEIIYEQKNYKFNEFSSGIQSPANPLPERVREIISSVYSCFEISEDQTLKKYTGCGSRVKIPEDINSIGDEAFRNCVRTAEIDIPRGVQNIGKLTFSGSGWLEKTRSQNKVTIINNMIIDGVNCGRTVEIPENISRICSWSFAGNTALEEVKFLGDRTIVDEYAFRNCIRLKKIVDKNGRVFELTDINSKNDPNLPENIRKIFSECVNCFKVDNLGNLLESTGNIKDLAFVNGIKSIGERVYKDCNLLCEITLCPETETIGESAFENGKWLRTVRNAVGVKIIEKCAFSGCQSLEEIELSDALEFIGKRAFEHCCNLCAIRLPEGVRVIPERAFFRCKSLKKIEFPSTLERIDREAFSFCSELEEIQIYEHTKLGENAFANCPKLKIKRVKKCGTENSETQA